MRRHALGALGCLLAGVLGGSLVAADAEPAPDASPEAVFEGSRARFARLAESRSLLWDYLAIEEFALAPGDKVIPTMLAELTKAQPRGLEHRVYLLANAIALRAKGRQGEKPLQDSEAAALIEFLRGKLSDPSQYWTAYNIALALAPRRAEREELEALLLDAEIPGALRAAVLLGLAGAGEASVLEKIEPLLAGASELRGREDRARLQEAAAWAAAALSAPLLEGDRKRREKALRARSADAAGDEVDEEVDDSAIAEAWGLAPGGTPEAPQDSRSPPGPRVSRNAGREAAVRYLSPILALLDDAKISTRTRLQVMRALQHAWGTPVAYDSAEAWRQLAADAERIEEAEPSHTAVRFFGIPSWGGDRILFLLDGSDSMLTPLSPEEKAALGELLADPSDSEEAPLSGAPAERSTARGRGEAPSRGKTGVGSGRSILSPLDSRDWESVKTRFDAARAHLKHTLALMSDDVAFAVVLFGAEAEPLRTTPSFVKATEANRIRVIRELDSIVAGPTDATHPHGRLRGETNIYGAFALAFSLGAGPGGAPGRGSGGRGGGVSGSSTTGVGPPRDPRSIDRCADTIYLLSDGMPTRDGFRGATPVLEQGGHWFPAVPEMEGEREVIINPETGATRKEKFRIPASPRKYVPKTKVSSTDETGPYVHAEPLAAEIRRLNLFPRATVHVVAIGEAGMWLSAEVARAARGRCLKISARGEREDL